MTEIDDKLRAKMHELAERIERQMPVGIGTMVWFYNKLGEHLDLVAFHSNDDPGETLRILRATMGQLLAEYSGSERWFDAGDGPRSDHLVSSAAVTRMGAHDRVRLWSRGGLAGELLVSEGDGERIAVTLGLSERADG